MDNSKINVYVGMSGGVDSSLTAAILKEQGYNVTGVYMKNWTQDLPGMKCPWADDLADAKRVAVQLGIDFKVFDFETQYREKVVQYMLDEYKIGRTPNPDIMCNQEVKFKLFLEMALEDGADYIATGHYASIYKNGNISELKMAKDQNKDQTYFLYRISGEAVAKTIFPLGDFTKPEVRKMAADRNLFTAAKKDSQGICFVGKIGIRDFLKQFIPEQKPGKIIDRETKKVVGYHDGAIFYTLGQRHGLNIGGGLPFYVCGKNMGRNEIYITTDLNDNSLWTKEINIQSSHWINQPAPDDEMVKIRIRHRAPLVDARITYKDSGELSLRLKDEQRAVTPGQSVVIYHNDICMGGGIVI